MARKEKVYVVPQTDGNRDAGKRYVITEMPASRAEKWAMRALLAVSKSGLDIPDELMGAGMQAIAVMGIRGLGTLQFEDAEGLLDEMMTCVTIAPDSSRPEIRRPLVENDIEEIVTRLDLRREVIDLHMGFFKPAAKSTST